MAIVMALNSAWVSDISGWDYMAQLSYGWNGDMWGPKEIITTTPDEVIGSQYMMWDADPYDGVDSGWVSAGLTFDGNDGLFWGAGGAGVSNELESSDGIDHIDIRTVAKGQASIAWDDLAVAFYKDGVLTELIELGGLSSDTVDDPGVEQSLLRITPDNPDNDKVVVAGMVKLYAPEGSFPAEDDLFSQIMIYS